MHTVAMAPSLTGQQTLTFLLQLCLLLCLAVLFGRLVTRIGLPAVVGELLVGVILGPSLLGSLPAHLTGWLPQRDSGQLALVEVVGQLGVLLLVGITGAEMSLGMIRRRGTTALRVSVAGLVVPLGLGIGLGFLLPAMLFGANAGRTSFALFLGVAMCVSALPVIAKILMDLRLNQSTVGQLILTAGLVDDAVGWLLLSFVSAMATAGLTAASALSSVGALALVVIVAVTIGRPVVRIVLGRAGRSGEPAPVLGATVALILLAAAGAQAIGLEAVLGAFVCGILISSSGRLPENWMAPLRTFVLAVLAPVFFALAGLRMDLRLLAKPQVALAGLAVLAIAILGKFLGAYLGARLSRLNRWEALAIGAGLNARGVIEVIVATIGVKLGVLNTASYTVVVLVALVTSLMAPPLLRFAMARVERAGQPRVRPIETAPSVAATDPLPPPSDKAA
jgi:Kef-type K+ transport system membrane component KefB